MSSMSRSDKCILAIAIFWAVLFVSYSAHRTPTLDTPSFFLTMVFVVAILFSFIAMIARWRQLGPSAGRSFLFCVAIAFLATRVIGPIRNVLFARALPSYEAVVSDIATGHLPTTGNFGQVPQAVARSKMTWQVWQEKTTTGVLMVEFDTERSFPAQHSGYVYSASGIIEPGSQMASRWHLKHRLRDHWFFVSD